MQYLLEPTQVPRIVFFIYSFLLVAQSIALYDTLKRSKKQYEMIDINWKMLNELADVHLQELSTLREFLEAQQKPAKKKTN